MAMWVYIEQIGISSDVLIFSELPYFIHKKISESFSLDSQANFKFIVTNLLFVVFYDFADVMMRWCDFVVIIVTYFLIEIMLLLLIKKIVFTFIFSG